MKTSAPFQKNFKSLSLPSQVGLPKIPFSLSHTADAGTPAKRAPSPVANGPTSSESSKLSGTLSFSLYPSLPHFFSYLTSLISQVLLLREMMPFFLIFEVTIRSYFYQHNPMDWYFLVRFSSPLYLPAFPSFKRHREMGISQFWSFSVCWTNHTIWSVTA